MKYLTVPLVILLLPVLCLAQFDDVETMEDRAELHGSVGVAWQSSYIWRGFDVYAEDKAAVQFDADLDLFGTGFGLKAVGHRANTSGFENGERWDYNIYYSNVLFPGSPDQTHYRVGFVHYNYPQLASETRDLQEMHAVFFWPRKTGKAELVPGYAIIGAWPARSGSTLGPNASGFLHVLMFDYIFSVPGSFADSPEQTFKLHGELVYNDEWHLTARRVDSDWSHALLGISADFDLGFGITVTPSIYQQISMEDTVNAEDEAWLNLAARYSF